MKRSASKPLSWFSLPRVLLLCGVVIGASSGAWLAIAASGDPWADAVQSSSGIGVSQPGNAVGAPDGRYANLVGVLRSITLDLGKGEEGTGALRVHAGALAVQAGVRVDFLDDQLKTLQSDTQLLSISLNVQKKDFSYTGSRPYRYVRLSSAADVGFALDAVEALSLVQEEATVPPSIPPANPTSTPNSPTEPTPNPTPTNPTPPPTNPTPQPTTPTTNNCQNDSWNCGAWTVCAANGTEARTCTMTIDCPGVATASPQLSRQCIPPQSSSNSNTSQTTTLVTTAAPGTEPTIPPTNTTTRGSSTAGSDSTPPVISNVESVSLDKTTEKITWTTNELSDGQVEYGTEDGAQRFTPNDTRVSTEHVVWLSNLEPGKEYVFRALSRDAAGNESVSSEGRFMTPPGDSLFPMMMNEDGTYGSCGWLSGILAILLLIASILAAYWHGKSTRPVTTAPKKER